MSLPDFRRLRHLTHTILLCAGLFLNVAAQAQVYTIGDLIISVPWARATVPGQPAGGAYLSIENKGKTGDKLVAVSSPIAKSAEVHSMSMDGNIMRMREVGSIDIKPQEKIAMQPGNGYHIMLMGLSKPLNIGDKFPLSLRFEKGGKLDVSVSVKELEGNKDGAMNGMHH